MTAILLASAVGGCTAGQIVDDNFKPHPIGYGSLRFVGVDDNGKETGRVYTYEFSGDTSANGAYVVFDYYADDTMSATSGLRNEKVAIQPGRYYLDLAGTYSPPAQSGIFEHTYEGGCTDGITGQSDAWCTDYYFQLRYSYGRDEFCWGSQGCLAKPFALRGNIPVVPLYTWMR